MRVKIQFGEETNTADITWDKEVKDFPRLVKYNGEKYSFAMYETDPMFTYDYFFYFSAVTYNHPQYWHFTQDLYDFARAWGDKNCQCGAKYNKGWEQFHMHYCPLWKKI